jgi:hypothetical protein
VPHGHASPPHQQARAPHVRGEPGATLPGQGRRGGRTSRRGGPGRDGPVVAPHPCLGPVEIQVTGDGQHTGLRGVALVVEGPQGLGVHRPEIRAAPGAVDAHHVPTVGVSAWVEHVRQHRGVQAVGGGQQPKGLGPHHPLLHRHRGGIEAGGRQPLGLERQGTLEGAGWHGRDEAGPVVVGPGVGVAPQGLELEIEALPGQALGAREHRVLQQVGRAGQALGIVPGPRGHQQLHAHHRGAGLGVQHHLHAVVQPEAAMLPAQRRLGQRGRHQQRRPHQKRCPLMARYRASPPNTTRWKRARGRQATSTARHRRTSSPRRRATTCSTVPA